MDNEPNYRLRRSANARETNPERHSKRDVFFGRFDGSGATLFGGECFMMAWHNWSWKSAAATERPWFARRSSADRTNGWETTNQPGKTAPYRMEGVPQRPLRVTATAIF
ncbi:hypothetical protein QBC32DRAFT_101564 [Pseudoneurospora amorphoporcata]|uniref:Uncharacterized protein n=1 Tax=Pseudoneurospora amorphoporcata TaxID=241081 RepID=A0AAN6NXQ3_9PEZI|nr:hypothetical protein QBC32DRAFT_101564 [Pseudoneurospora amorphoporcata]